MEDDVAARALRCQARKKKDLLLSLLFCIYYPKHPGLFIFFSVLFYFYLVGLNWKQY
jgi:hypothetical protein